MNKPNYQKELEKIIRGIDINNPPGLLLHSCCAPCSSYCLEYLKKYFRITVFYYNPNISFEEEYKKRVLEQKRLIGEYNKLEDGNRIDIIEGDYEPKLFFETVKGLEKCPEGGDRCKKCFELRLLKTLKLAEENHFDYFGTTLTISPLKNAENINNIGHELSEGKSVRWLWSDFKKNEGYKRSIELSKQYGLYRQNYCGCVYSKDGNE